MNTRSASCSCGQLRVTVQGEPLRVSVCHCLACQKRTGSVFGQQARFDRSGFAASGDATEFVRVGDEVDEGQPLGRIGSVGYSTGPHLHFAVVDFDTDRYIDPVTWLPKKRATGAYRGTVPHAPKLTFDEVSEAVPDYADPAPPAVPQQQAPQQGAATNDAGTGDSSKQDTRARERRKDRHDAKRAEKKAARAARRAEILAAREAARAEQADAEEHTKRSTEESSDSSGRDRKDR